ncbi:7733_t:CDS:2, partial [Racocetra persica]
KNNRILTEYGIIKKVLGNYNYNNFKEYRKLAFISKDFFIASKNVLITLYLIDIDDICYNPRPTHKYYIEYNVTKNLILNDRFSNIRSIYYNWSSLTTTAVSHSKRFYPAITNEYFYKKLIRNPFNKTFERDSEDRIVIDMKDIMIKTANISFNRQLSSKESTTAFRRPYHELIPVTDHEHGHYVTTPSDIADKWIYEDINILDLSNKTKSILSNLIDSYEYQIDGVSIVEMGY